MGTTMKKRLRCMWLAALGLVLATALIPTAAFASMGGIDHLPDYLSVSDFSVNGAGGFQAGDGHAGVPSPVLPDKWHPGLTVHVEWAISDWKHGGGRPPDADVSGGPYTPQGNPMVPLPLEP